MGAGAVSLGLGLCAHILRYSPGIPVASELVGQDTIWGKLRKRVVRSRQSI